MEFPTGAAGAACHAFPSSRIARISVCKQWIEKRLKELVGMFAVELAGFAVMDNHLHLLVRLDSKKAQEWSVNEVVRRWLSVFPLRDTAGKALPVSQARVELWPGTPAGWRRAQAAGRSELVYEVFEGAPGSPGQPRRRLQRAFWEGRFKSVAVLDEESLLATAA